MTAVLQEAWLWLLLAFVLGLVIGYFLRRYTIGEDPADAEAPVAAPAASDAEASDPPETRDGEPAVEKAADDAASSTSDDQGSEKDSGAYETASTTLAELSASAPSPAEAEGGDDDSAPSAGSPEEELQEGPHFDESVHAEHVDAGDVYMPVVEPLRVPHGRREAASLSATSAQESEAHEVSEVPAPDQGADAMASVIDEEGAEAAVRDAEKGKPKRRSRRPS